MDLCQWSLEYLLLSLHGDRAAVCSLHVVDIFPPCNFTSDPCNTDTAQWDLVWVAWRDAWAGCTSGGCLGNALNSQLAAGLQTNVFSSRFAQKQRIIAGLVPEAEFEPGSKKGLKHVSLFTGFLRKLKHACTCSCWRKTRKLSTSKHKDTQLQGKNLDNGNFCCWPRSYQNEIQYLSSPKGSPAAASKIRGMEAVATASRRDSAAAPQDISLPHSSNSQRSLAGQGSHRMATAGNSLPCSFQKPTLWVFHWIGD